MLPLLRLMGGAAWACLCACGLLLALQGALATHLDQEPGVRPWLEATPSLSADGRVLAFDASRDGLAETPPRVLGRPLPGRPRQWMDIVVADLERGAAEIVTGRSDGSSVTPRLDGTGRHLVFASDATNLLPGVAPGVRSIYLLDRSSGILRRVPSPGKRVGYDSSSEPTLSMDGRWGAFSTYGLGEKDDPVHLRRPAMFDVEGGPARLVEVADPRVGPILGRPEFSPDSRRLIFAAFAPGRSAPSGLVELFACPLEARTGLREPGISAARLPTAATGGTDAVSLTPVLSEGACAYVCRATSSRGRGVLEVRVRDLATGADECVSVSPRGQPGDDDSVEPAMSVDGRWVAFSSFASNLVPGDRNGAMDVFLRDRQAGRTILVSHTPRGLAGDGPSDSPSISADGRRIAYVSRATDLDGTPCARGQVFVWDRATDSSRRVSLPATPAKDRP